ALPRPPSPATHDRPGTGSTRARRVEEDRQQGRRFWQRLLPIRDIEVEQPVSSWPTQVSVGQSARGRRQIPGGDMGQAITSRGRSAYRADLGPDAPSKRTGLAAPVPARRIEPAVGGGD